MTLSPKTKRTLLRTACVFVAAAIVMAATYALTPPYDANRIETAQRKAAKTQPPAPGSAAALRQAMGEIQSGIPDYDRITRARAGLMASLNPVQRTLVAILGGIPVRTHQQLLDEAREQKQDLAGMGQMQSVTYLGGNAREYRFRVNYRKGSLRWGVTLDGKLLSFGFGDDAPPSPQQWIASYAQFSAHERLNRMATQLGVLLAIAIFARFALRVRL